MTKKEKLYAIVMMKSFTIQYLKGNLRWHNGVYTWPNAEILCIEELVDMGWDHRCGVGGGGGG